MKKLADSPFKKKRKLHRARVDAQKKSKPNNPYSIRQNSTHYAVLVPTQGQAITDDTYISNGSLMVTFSSSTDEEPAEFLEVYGSFCKRHTVRVPLPKDAAAVVDKIIIKEDTAWFAISKTKSNSTPSALTINSFNGVSRVTVSA
jgi:hypothetical protein